MKLPKNWNQIRVDQFKELYNLARGDFDSLFLYNLELLAIVTDQDADDIDISVDELTDYVKDLTFLQREPPKTLEKTIDNLTYKGVKHLTLGEFIDLEYYFALDYINNLEVICSILYRKTGINDWSELTFEPYRYDPKDRVEIFSELPITSLYGVVRDYMDFRESFLKSYENLFQPDIEETDEELSPEDKKEEEKEKRLEKWSWEMVIYELAGEDITKVDQVTDLPLILAFNFLSMKYETKT